MFYDAQRARAITQIKEILKTTPYVRDYLTEIKLSTSQFATKDKLIVRIWLKQDIKDAEDVALTLAGIETLEEKIRNLATTANLAVTYDIYNV